MAKVFSIGGSTISYGGFLLRELGSGSLTISKTVSGSGFDPAKTFELTVTFSKAVTYNGTTSTTHTFNLANGQSVTITGIPELTEYSVVETPLSQADLDAGYSISGITGGSGTVALDGVHTAAASNGYSSPATLTITKNVSGNTPSPSESFEIVVTFGRAIKYSVNGTTIATASDTCTLNLVNGQSVTIGNIPGGVTYNITENLTQAEQAAGYSLTGITGGSGTAAWAGTHAATVNNLLLGSISPFTIRMKFSNGYNPTSYEWEDQPGFWKQGSTWTQISSEPNIWEYHREPTGEGDSWANELAWDSQGSGLIYNFFSKAGDIDVIAVNFGTISLASAFLGDANYKVKSVSGVVGTQNLSCYRLFDTMPNLASVSLFDTSASTTFYRMFASCASLETVPTFNTQSATSIEAMFSNCQSLKEVPQLNVANVTNCRHAFYSCFNVESGALDLYNDLSQLGISSYWHGGTFAGCGADTVTGAAELAQIPSDWKNWN